MSNNRYAAFFAAYNSSVKRGNPLSREEQISQFTDGRTESLKGLNDWELNELTIRLNHMNLNHFNKASIDNPKGDRMRKSIIAIFHQMDKSPADAKAWAEKQGVAGAKKRFNDYTNQELFQLILVAEKVLKDYQQAIRKRLKTSLS